MSDPRRPGIVLFAAILFIVVAALAITTGSYVAAQAALVARARADAVRAHLAAESAVRAAAASWRATDDRALPLLGRRRLPRALGLPGGAVATTAVRRLAGDLYLLEGDGRAGAARARAGALVRVLAIRTFLADFPAALAAGNSRMVAGATVGAIPPDAPPFPWPGSVCDPAAADSLLAVFGTATLPGGAVPAAGDPVGLGPLTWDRLASWADRVEAGALAPAPAERDGACDLAAPANWGAPLAQHSPCATDFPLIYAPGDLRITGGSGQGVLVVRGNLLIEGDFRFFGAVLVGGSVTAHAGTYVAGAVRAADAEWGGELDLSPCALLRALAAAPGLGRPLRAGVRWWIPLF